MLMLMLMPNSHVLLPYEDPGGQPYSLALHPEEISQLMRSCNDFKYC